MLIGIVVPAFNMERFIRAAIGSVLAQTHADWVMAVVDDGSTDNTAAAAALFLDPRIRVIQQANGGVSAARNCGIAALDPDAFLFLDADDWLAPDALARLAEALTAAPDAIAAAGPYQRMIAADTGALCPVGPIRRPAHGWLLERLLVRNLFVNGGQLLIRQQAVRDAGGFRTDLRYGEDWEYWVTLAARGTFATAAGRASVLFVRDRPDGAYRAMAASPGSFDPCMAAIHGNPALREHFPPARLTALRRRAEAENHWVIGRALSHLGRKREAMTWLHRSVRAAPGMKRLALLAAAHVASFRVRPFKPLTGSGPVRLVKYQLK